MSAATLPLEGVRIVDFTAYWAGPLPSAIMADLGAEVIKVESIRRPDRFRIVAIPYSLGTRGKTCKTWT